jgi:TolB protein
MKMFNRSINKKLLLILSIGFSFAYADQNIEIVGGNSAGNPKLAVVNFTNEDGSVSDEVTSDFKITGEFNVLNYVSSDTVESGAQYTITGNVSQDPVSGQMQIEYQLLNNTTNQVLLSQTAAFNKKFQRKAIHAIDDNIYKKLTNTPSAFTSKVALAVQQGAAKYAVVIADYDGYNPKTLISMAHPITSLAWDKTGKYLSYVTYESGKPVTYVQNIAAGTRYVVANFNGSNSSPAFTANSQKLAVTLSKDYGSHVYLVNNQRYTSSSQAIPLINFGTIDTEADISNTGKVVFTSDHDGGPQIFMTDLDGSSPMRVTNGLGKYNTTARFSNDASKITFINRNSGVLQAYVLDLVTQSAYPISQNANHDIAPSFAPNDKLIMFSSDNGVYISNITGTTQTKLNNLNYGQVIDQRWSKSF